MLNPPYITYEKSTFVTSVEHTFLKVRSSRFPMHFAIQWVKLATFDLRKSMFHWNDEGRFLICDAEGLRDQYNVWTITNAICFMFGLLPLILSHISVHITSFAYSIIIFHKTCNTKNICPNVRLATVKVSNQYAGFVRSWKTWKSHGILKWLFPGLEKCLKKIKSQKFWKSHGNFFYSYFLVVHLRWVLNHEYAFKWNTLKV